MDAGLRKRLEAKGYRIYDDAADWLGLTDEERAEVELRLALSRAICRLRDEQGLDRRQLAARLSAQLCPFAITPPINSLHGTFIPAK